MKQKMEDWYNLALIIFSLLLLLKLFLRTQQKHKNFPPSPPALPIIGHLHLLKKPALYQSFRALSDKYGPILLLRLGTRKVLVVTSPAAVQECFTKNDVVFANRPDSLVGKHLNYNSTTLGIVSYGDLWRNLRRVTSLEVFSTTRLVMTSGIRQNEVALLVSQLMKSCTSTTTNSRIHDDWTSVELKSKFFEFPFDALAMIIAKKRFYRENVDDEKEASRFRYLIREHVELSKPENTAVFFPVLQWLSYRKIKRRMIEVTKEMDKFFQSLVDQCRQRRTSSNTGDTRESHVPSESKSILDNLLSLQEKEPEFCTDEMIKGIILVLLVAGTESSSSTMEWAMSLMLNNPDVMDKVRAEIDTHVGQDRLLEEQDLKKLKYLQNVIDETLRLYPAGPLLLPHESAVDCQVGGYDIPRGTLLSVNAWAIHRDPKLWENPTKFMPERFEDERVAEGYIPFGLGRRVCPGAALASRMVGLVLGTLIQAFEWKRVGEEEVDMVVVPNMIMPKSNPLVAVCRPRATMIKYLR